MLPFALNYDMVVDDHIKSESHQAIDKVELCNSCVMPTFPAPTLRTLPVCGIEKSFSKLSKLQCT